MIFVIWTADFGTVILTNAHSPLSFLKWKRTILLFIYAQLRHFLLGVINELRALLVQASPFKVHKLITERSQSASAHNKLHSERFLTVPKLVLQHHKQCMVAPRVIWSWRDSVTQAADLIVQSDNLLIVCTHYPWSCGRDTSACCTAMSVVPAQLISRCYRLMGSQKITPRVDGMLGSWQ